jgi:hypothetical protein
MTTLIPASIFDTFSRSVASGSWGDTDTGQTWVDETTGMSVTGGVGKAIVNTTISAWKNSYIDLSAEGMSNQGTAEVLTLVRHTSAAAYPTTDFGPTLRVSGNTYYAFSIQGNWSEVAIRVLVNGVPEELIRTAKTIAKDTWYWVRFRADTALRAKVWTYGTAEPAAWTITHSYSTKAGAPLSGDVGFYTRKLDSDYTVEVRGYYMKTLEDTEKVLPVTDTFTRTQSDKWGVTDSGHVWTGPVNYDPQTYAPGQTFSTVGTAGDFPVGTATRSVRIGPNELNVETYAKFTLINQKGTVSIVGRASGWQTPTSTGQVLDDGYYAAFLGNTNQLQLWKLVNNVGTQLGSTFALATVNLGDLWHVRLKCLGTTIECKAWKDGTGEPGYQITATDSSINTAGSAGIRMASATGTMTARFYDFSYSAASNTAATTTVSAAASSITDTSLVLTAEYTNDTDTDGDVYGWIKPLGSEESEWVAITGWTKNTGPTNYTKTVTGLSAATVYEIEVTFTDPDGVIGTNPILLQATTTGNGLRTGIVRVVGSNSTSLDVEATYFSDADQDSSATLEYRPVNTINTFLTDDFADLPSTLLATHVPEVGGTWTINNPHALISPVIRNNSASVIFGTGSVDETTQNIYNTVTPPSADYSVRGTIRFVAHGAKAALMARFNSANSDQYAGGLYYDSNGVTPKWAIEKSVSGVRTTLASVLITDTMEVGDSFDIELKVSGTSIILYVNGVQTLAAVDSAVTGVGKPGFRWAFVVEPLDKTAILPVNFFTNITAFSRSVVGAGTWTSAGAMTADRTNKKFTKTIGSLTADTIYELRADYTDPDGVTGADPITTTGMTNGTALALTSLGLSPSYTSISVEVNYDGDSDTNGNGKVFIRYRSAQDSSFWINGVPEGQIHNDTVNNIFTTAITGLRPGTVYEIEAVNADPNGAVEGSPLSLSTTAKTLEAAGDVSILFNEKQYLWKVHDGDGNYIETWRDAGIPEFTWEEGRGVDKVTAELPRRFSEATHTRSSLKLENRVDIFTFAPLSSGIGPNLVVDPEFTKGGWTLGQNAQTVTTGGPTGANALYITNEYFIEDSFTDTAGTMLTAHISDGGYAWTLLTPLHELTITDKGEAKGTVTSERSLYQIGETIPTANYSVFGTLKSYEATDGDIGIAARIQDASNYYYMNYSGTSGGQFAIIKIVAGVLTSLGTYASVLPPDTVASMEFRLSGTSLKGFVDGVERISVTDSAISAAGRAGVRAFGKPLTTDGNVLEYFKVKATLSTQAYTTRSAPIHVDTTRATEDVFSDVETLVPSETILSALVRSPLGQLNAFIEAYGKPDTDGSENLIDVSDSIFSIGGGWQALKLSYVPPLETDYLRICFRNISTSQIYISKVVLRSKEKLLFRGFIKEISPSITSSSENIEVTMYGLDFVLDALYIDFLQFSDTPETRDIGKPNEGAADPGTIVKRIVDNIQRQNPSKVWLYYTEDSIGLTGEVQNYIIRDITALTALERAVELCPPGWWLRIEPDGLVTMDSAANATLHKLNIGVEISEYEYTLSSGARKNYIIVNGRQDDDGSEPDGFGTIKKIAFDQASIDKHGKVVHILNDSDLTTPDSADIVAQGMLDKMNRDEIQGTATVLDNSSILSMDTSLRGYNIESLRPGDYVTVNDAVSSPNFSYWDDFLWEVGYWDVESNAVTPESMPILRIDYKGELCVIHLNERPPSVVGSFARYHRWLQLKEQADLRR